MLKDHHALTDRHVRHLGSDLDHLAHRLVPEHIAGVQERSEHLVQMEVRAAQPGRGDADHRVVRLLDLWVRHGVDADVTLAMPGQCLHQRLLSSVG
jgi:hypothetical protein